MKLRKKLMATLSACILAVSFVGLQVSAATPAPSQIPVIKSIDAGSETIQPLIFLKTSGSVIGKFVKQEIESQLKNAVFRDEMRRSFVCNLNTGHQTGRGLFLLQKAPSCRPSGGNSPEKCASPDKAFRALRSASRAPPLDPAMF